MSNEIGSITCPLCGSVFQPSKEQACAACPLHGDCAMVCCPSCGYTTLAPGSSRLARGATRWLAAFGRRRGGRREASPAQTLDGAPIGAEVRVSAFGALAPEHRDWLQAYGVRPGHAVRVLQHWPTTIVQVEQVELTFESAIAREVRIEAG